MNNELKFNLILIELKKKMIFFFNFLNLFLLFFIFFNNFLNLFLLFFIFLNFLFKNTPRNPLNKNIPLPLSIKTPPQKNFALTPFFHFVILELRNSWTRVMQKFVRKWIKTDVLVRKLVFKCSHNRGKMLTVNLVRCLNPPGIKL